jgi:hypothetical protein
MNHARPTSIRIFLADGVPEGLRLVEKSNWTGRAVVVNRSQLDRALARDELKRPGVYVLTGAADEGTMQLYVGEADVLGERLKQHVAGKEFWTRVVAFTSTNEGLNKGHVRYLESRLLGLAKAANQWALDNGTFPGPPPLNEADRADAEWFLAEMLIIFPLLGIDAFESATDQARVEPVRFQQPRVELQLNERGAQARGREVADGFVVLEGAKARATETDSTTCEIFASSFWGAVCSYATAIICASRRIFVSRRPRARPAYWWVEAPTGEFAGKTTAAGR